jgi:hypothetical protein
MILLALVSERPMYGYELISTLEQRGGKRSRSRGHALPGAVPSGERRADDPRMGNTGSGRAAQVLPAYGSGKRTAPGVIRDWQGFAAAVNRLLNKEG